MNPGAASVLAPAGPAAALSAEVSWVLIGGAALIFVVTMALLVVATWRGGAADGAPPVRDRSRLWIVGGGLVVPVAVATSRRKVLERSWDKTTINLPFGRSAIIIGDPIHVSADAGEAEMEAKRRDITDGLNAAMSRVYGVVGAAQ